MDQKVASSSINYGELAKNVTGVYEKVAGTMVTRNGSLLAAYSRPGMPMPQKEKLRELILQAELVVSISKRNADIFGEVKVATIQHGILAVFIFPLKDQSVVAFAVEGALCGDHSVEMLSSKVGDIIREMDPALY